MTLCDYGIENVFIFFINLQTQTIFKTHDHTILQRQHQIHVNLNVIIIMNCIIMKLQLNKNNNCINKYIGIEHHENGIIWHNEQEKNPICNT